MNQPPEKVAVISPDNREVIEHVMKATCEYFNVTRVQLIQEHKLSTARHICYFIIKNSTHGIYDYNIGSFFNRKRTSVQYGIDLIDHHKDIYRQVLGNINSIIQIANNFEKKYPWHLQPVNTMH